MRRSVSANDCSAPEPSWKQKACPTVMDIASVPYACLAAFVARAVIRSIRIFNSWLESLANHNETLPAYTGRNSHKLGKRLPALEPCSSKLRCLRLHRPSAITRPTKSYLSSTRIGKIGDRSLIALHQSKSGVRWFHAVPHDGTAWRDSRPCRLSNSAVCRLSWRVRSGR